MFPGTTGLQSKLVKKDCASLTFYPGNDIKKLFPVCENSIYRGTAVKVISAKEFANSFRKISQFFVDLDASTQKCPPSPEISVSLKFSLF